MGMGSAVMSQLALVGGLHAAVEVDMAACLPGMLTTTPACSRQQVQNGSSQQAPLGGGHHQPALAIESAATWCARHCCMKITAALYACREEVC
jgi:hypothetical protein